MNTCCVLLASAVFADALAVPACSSTLDQPSIVHLLRRQLVAHTPTLHVRLPSLLQCALHRPVVLSPVNRRDLAALPAAEHHDPSPRLPHDPGCNTAAASCCGMTKPTRRT